MNIQATLSAMTAAVRSRPRNAIYSVLILLNHFSFGVNMNILGATLVDLRFIYGVDAETASLMSVSVAIGYIVGALTGFLYRWLNRQLMLSLFVMLLATTIAIVPNYGHFWVGMAGLLLNGVGGGAWDACSGFWMVEMWPVGNAAMLQLIQFMYGLGSVAAPLIVAPFVFGLAEGKNVTVDQRVESLRKPFAITGGALLIVPITMLVMFLVCRYEKAEDEPATAVEATKKSDDAELEGPITGAVVDPSTVRWRVTKLALCGFCLATYATAELGWVAFSNSMFQYLLRSDITAGEAAVLQSVQSTFFTGGRLVTAAITFVLVPDYIMSYHYVGSFVALTVLVAFYRTRWILFVGVALMGAGYSALWPAIQALTERHLKLSDRVCAVFSSLTGLMSMIIPVVLSVVSLSDHPWMLFLLEAVFLSISVALFVTVRTWIWLDSRR